jgi:hypothetical protein
MSLRADIYRRKAAEAKQSAARAINPSMKQAFEELAARWLLIAEEVEWMESKKTSPNEKPKLRS